MSACRGFHWRKYHDDDQQPTTNSQQPTANSHKWLLICTTILLCFIAISPVMAQDDPQTLKPITVNGMPFYVPAPMFSVFIFSVRNFKKRKYATISDEDTFDHADACQLLANLKPKSGGPGGSQCTLNNFPAAPGYPSHVGAQFAGNGCGSGGIANLVAKELLKRRHPFAFSGNLDFPLDDYPSVSFTSACNAHDACYTTAGGSRKECDGNFFKDMMSICLDLTTTSAGSTCGMFASDYAAGVHKFGKSAYKSGQAQARCAQWGNAMKKNRCSE